MRRAILATLALPLASAANVASNCEPLRAVIETRIRANGIADPVVTVVDASASAPGRVVGTCERGAKKIVYAAGPSSAAARPAPPRGHEPILTECRDGSVTMGGDCRRR